VGPDGEYEPDDPLPPEGLMLSDPPPEPPELAWASEATKTKRSAVLSIGGIVGPILIAMEFLPPAVLSPSSSSSLRSFQFQWRGRAVWYIFTAVRVFVVCVMCRKVPRV
jgi:hypothetical protein